MSPPPGADIDFRPLSPGDLAAAVRIERECFASPWPREAFEMAIHDGSILAAGAFAAGEPAGYVIACSGARSVLIANLAVARRWRRRGLGRRLLQRALDWAGREGHRLVSLEVRQSNEAAIRLYRDAGFGAVKVRPGYYSDPPEDALTMVRLLNDGPCSG